MAGTTIDEALMASGAAAFNRDDCEFLRRYEERPSWTVVPTQDRDALPKLRCLESRGRGRSRE